MTDNNKKEMPVELLGALLKEAGCRVEVAQKRQELQDLERKLASLEQEARMIMNFLNCGRPA